MQLLGDFTQGELARASGVSATTISLFLAGKRKLRPPDGRAARRGAGACVRPKGITS